MVLGFGAICRLSRQFGSARSEVQGVVFEACFFRETNLLKELLLFRAVLFYSNHKCKHSEGLVRATVEWQMMHPFLDAASEKRRK